MNRRRFLRNSAGVLVPLSFGIITRVKAQGNFQLQRQIAADGFTAGGAASYHLVEDIGTTPNDFNEVGDVAQNTYRGFSWAPASSYSLRRIAIYITKNGTPTSTMTCRIFTGASTVPVSQTGSDSDTLSNAQITAGDYNNFTFPGDISLTSGTRYWVVPFVSSSGGNYYQVNDNGSGTQNLAHSTDGSTWTSDCSSCLLITMKTYSYS